MYQGSKNKDLALYNSLDREGFMCEQKANRSREDRVKAVKLASELEQYKSVLSLFKLSLKEMQDLIKELQEYLTTRKKNGLQAIRSGIMATRAIIPNSSPVTLEVDGGKAWLANQTGHNVSMIEGGAFRAIISMFMRERLLKNSVYLQTLFEDEGLATLDSENSAEFSKYLKVMSSTVPIVVIEQKEAVFSSAPHIYYNFEKINGKTNVWKGVRMCTE